MSKIVFHQSMTGGIIDIKMLHPEEMKKVLIVGPDTYLEKVIYTLYGLGVLHIVEHKSTEGIDIGTPLKQSENISQLLVTIRSIANNLNIDLKKELKSVREKHGLTAISKDVKTINERLSFIREQLSVIDDTIKQKKQIVTELATLKKINLSFSEFAGYKSLASYVGVIIKPKGFIEGLNKITSKFELINVEENNKLYFALFADKSYVNDIYNLLQRHGFVPIDISKYNGEKSIHGDFDKQTPANIFDKVTLEIKKLNEERERLLKDLEKCKSKWGEYLISTERFLSKELEKSQVPLKFAKTTNSFLITGWIPEKNLEKATQSLTKITNDKIYITTLEIGEHEHVPVNLKNPRMVKPFEFFMNLYSLPGHKEIDPTFFVFLSFPIFFGFMLGDIGYGLVTLVTFMLLKKKLPKLASFFDILIFASITTIIFGAVFGEFFGAEEILGHHIPRLISRNPVEKLDNLMIAAIFIGIIHVNIGLIIGFVNEMNGHGIKKAILAKGGWIVLELAVLFLALSYLNVLSITPILGYLLLAISIIMLFIGEGSRGIVEIPGLFGNVLSYLRLMAIGLSSVGLAIVINDLAGMFFEHPGILSIFGVLILVLGHIINIGLGILGGFLHSMRLHYVEFFTKFYKGGGINYLPFGRKNID